MPARGEGGVVVAHARVPRTFGSVVKSLYVFDFKRLFGVFQVVVDKVKSARLVLNYRDCRVPVPFQNVAFLVPFGVFIEPVRFPVIVICYKLSSLFEVS